ncbi:MAG TPA: HAMP domain-containing protein, partial [Candidatus Limnocylindrales bacterium]|nr:HAMP domain-containing protein [Candidatus Limnocylindrales bacterium]
MIDRPTAEDARPSESRLLAAHREAEAAAAQAARVAAPRRQLRIPFRTRLTFALVAAAVLPLATFGIAVLVVGGAGQAADPTLARLLIFAIALAFVFGVVIAYLLASDLMAPLRAIAAAFERASAGERTSPVEVFGDDEFARLAESHNRLAADLDRRNTELGRILVAM